MQLSRVGVVGAGTMGHGIAQVTALAGFDVVVREVSQPVLDASLGRIESAYARLAAKGKLSAAESEAAFARITGTTSYEDLADCDLVVEAVDEDLGTKQDMWR